MKPLTLETVKTQVGSCHKIGPLSFDFHGKPAYACIYVDGYTYGSSPNTKWAKSIEDAEFIVRAVNCHDDLLAACKNLLNEVEEAGFGGAKDFNWPKSISDARAAIAAAEGKGAL